jgi:hypothetical protein
MQINELPIEWQQLIVAAKRLNYGKMTITFVDGKPSSAKIPIEKDFKFGKISNNDFADELESIPLG